MIRHLSPVLYTADVNGKGTPAPAHEVRTAAQLGIKEDWFQNAIAATPRLVIEPCTEAGLTDETWWCWGREVETEVGPIDVLLVSESGRIGIVETKLAYNPEGRRKVVAQVLDYAAHLAGVGVAQLPALPAGAGLNPEQVERRIEEGDFLLIIAGDTLDSRAVKLSQAFLAQHMLSRWDLALVEISIFEENPRRSESPWLLVPHLRGVLEHEVRQVIKVTVDSSGRHRAVVAQAGSGDAPVAHSVVAATNAKRPVDARVRQARDDAAWTVPGFFAELDGGALPDEVKRFGRGLRTLVQRRPAIQLEGGDGKYGTLLLKKNQATILKLCLDRFIKLTPRSFQPALGDNAALAYAEGLRKLYPTEMAEQSQPLIWHSRPGARLDDLLSLLDRVLEQSETEQPPGTRQS